MTPHSFVRTETRAEGQFYLADCREVFRALPEGIVDVMVTSPPYNMGIRYNTYQDTLDQSEYLQWTSDWVAGAARVLAPFGDRVRDDDAGRARDPRALDHGEPDAAESGDDVESGARARRRRHERAR